MSVHDPLADAGEADELYGIALLDAFPNDFDCVVGCVAHDSYADFDFSSVLNQGGLIADLKGIWRKVGVRNGFRYWSL